MLMPAHSAPLVRCDAALVVSAPSVLGSWGRALVQEAVALLPAPPELHVLDRYDAASPAAPAGAVRRLYMCSFPSAEVIAAVAAGALPTVAFLDDPLDSVRYLRLRSSASLLEALRAQSASLTIAPALAAGTEVLVIRRTPQAEAVPAILAVLGRLGLVLPDVELAGLLERQTAGGTWHLLEDVLAYHVEGYLPLPALAEAVPAEDVALVSQVLMPVAAAADAGRPGRVTWPIGVFLSGDALGEPAPRIAEVTGGARILIYGPYMHLPAGDWRVSFTIGFSPGIEDIPFRLQAHANGLLGEARFMPPGHGLFAGSFVARHTRPNEGVEVLLCSDRGAIEGRVALVRVELEQIAGAAGAPGPAMPLRAVAEAPPP